MKLFDENGKEIFLYYYIEDDGECYSYSEYYSYRKIPKEDFEQIKEEHKALEMAYELEAEKARVESGLREAWAAPRSPAAIENVRAAFDKFSLLMKNNPRPTHIRDYIVEGFDLLPLGYEGSF